MNVQIYEEASDWVVKHRDVGIAAHEKQAFDRWLRESPQHVRAYLEMASIWEDLPALDRSWNADAEELIARARADANVVPLSSGLALADPRASAFSQPTSASTAMSGQAVARPARKPLVRKQHKLRFLGALAASVLVLVVSASWFYLQRGVYSTNVGEQRWLTLTDGSIIEINARSRIKVEYTRDERRVDLLEGQALFHVAKNKQRPFVVDTGDTRVRAVGTSFDVNRAKNGTVVTVIEGRVAVGTSQQPARARSSDSQSERAASGSNLARRVGRDRLSGAGGLAAMGEILIAAGEQLVVTPAAVPQPRAADIATATAWSRKSLVFDASPLTSVAEEFNRYSVRPLVIEDVALADFRVSGVFSSVDPTLLIRFLHAQPELVVEETETDIRVRNR
jgi:transmembrane sensor